MDQEVTTDQTPKRRTDRVDDRGGCKTIRRFTAESSRPDDASFDMLPDEVLLVALRFLSAHDLARLGCVCRRLAVLAADDQLWLEQILTLLRQPASVLIKPVDRTYRQHWLCLARAPRLLAPVDGVDSMELPDPCVVGKSVPRDNKFGDFEVVGNLLAARADDLTRKFELTAGPAGTFRLVERARFRRPVPKGRSFSIRCQVFPDRTLVIDNVVHSLSVLDAEFNLQSLVQLHDPSVDLFWISPFRGGLIALATDMLCWLDASTGRLSPTGQWLPNGVHRVGAPVVSGNRMAILRIGDTIQSSTPFPARSVPELLIWDGDLGAVPEVHRLAHALNSIVNLLSVGDEFLVVSQKDGHPTERSAGLVYSPSRRCTTNVRIASPSRLQVYEPASSSGIVYLMASNATGRVHVCALNVAAEVLWTQSVRYHVLTTCRLSAYRFDVYPYLLAAFPDGRLLIVATPNKLYVLSPSQN
eukprot:TRINITY_DN1555_c0_g1_i1.p1 TRINITY_DN1555_c0_g1~~TRINITY_DN1555_c0_g1_i1.p1  ORF type:complete len:471 (+),score=47.04 TRINITY_DN1555_c0_g1_i1:114-1526(+)